MNNVPRKLLITGGAGYIGSHTLVALSEAGHEAVVLDDLSNGHAEALRRAEQITGASFALVEGDIRDDWVLRRVFEEHSPQAVIHFAGLKSVAESVAKPELYYEVNLGGTERLLAAMAKAGCQKIVFSSSATVYGTPEYLPFDEQHRTGPVNPYGASKFAAERAIARWVHASPQRAGIALRYFNPVGAHPSGLIGEDPRGMPNNLMPYLTQVAVGRREALSVYGDDYDTRDGTGERDYLHVMDLARAHERAIAALEGRSDFLVVNIGTGSGVTVNEMVEAFRQASGKPIATNIAPRRDGDIARSFADASLAQRVLGWSAELTLEEMCRDAWAWQSSNPEGYGEQAA